MAKYTVETHLGTEEIGRVNDYVIESNGILQLRDSKGKTIAAFRDWVSVRKSGTTAAEAVTE